MALHDGIQIFSRWHSQSGNTGTYQTALVITNKDTDSSTTIIVWLFLLYVITSPARRGFDSRVTTSSVSGFGDSVCSLACSRTCVKLGDGLTCISDLGLPASLWRFLLLNPVFRVIDRPRRSLSRCWSRKSKAYCV